MAARTITSLDDPEFTRYFTSFKYTAWRLETLQHYQVDYETDALAYFREHRRLDASSRAAMGPWTNTIVGPAVAAGKYIGRVHVIECPTLPASEDTATGFSDYIDFEMHEYALSKAAGEDVRLIFCEPGRWPTGIWGPGNDFWLFDSSVMIEMHYRPDGTFREAHVVNEMTLPSGIVRANKCRDAAMMQSKPFYP